MATGLDNKTTPNGNPVTFGNVDWPLYFCNVKKQFGQNIWDSPPPFPAPPPGGKKAGEGVTVVHPDTGYTDHPELLKGQRLDLPRSKNFLYPAYPALDPLTEGAGRFPNHGTATGATLMSEPGHANDPAYGPPEFPAYTVPSHQYVTGMAPKAELIPCRITNSVVLVGDSIPALTKTLHYAVELSATDLSIGVVSVSLGCLVNRRVLQGALAKAVAHAKNNGVVICAAAGQLFDGANAFLGPRYPGHDVNAICVAACDSKHGMLSTGLYDSTVDITAPGVGVWRSVSTRAADGTRTYTVDSEGIGTSYATALVAGACALWQAHHGRTNLIATYGSPLIFDLFRWALFTSCDTRGNTWDTANHGRGVLDVEALLKIDRAAFPSKPQLQAWAASN